MKKIYELRLHASRSKSRKIEVNNEDVSDVEGLLKQFLVLCNITIYCGSHLRRVWAALNVRHLTDFWQMKTFYKGIWGLNLRIYNHNYDL